MPSSTHECIRSSAARIAASIAHLHSLHGKHEKTEALIRSTLALLPISDRAAAAIVNGKKVEDEVEDEDEARSWLATQVIETFSEGDLLASLATWA